VRHLAAGAFRGAEAEFARLPMLEQRMAMDTLSRKERSLRMSLIRNRDTKPELLVRRLVHGAGYRYRLHRAELPGKPDCGFRRAEKK